MRRCSSSIIGVLSGVRVAWIFSFISIIDSKSPSTQQSFKKEPVSISAAVGSEVTLECEVENQFGPVQWTKDGFALGYNRTIPGFSRYSFYADEERGIFNLNIQNVSLEDDSEFQCQVGPAAYTTTYHKPIRAGANLTVISPPVTIEIIGRENNSKIEVLEKHNITLQCQAKNAKPAARIVWYRAGTELKSNNQENNISESEKKNETRIQLYNVTSEIHLQPSVEDDAINYTCEAVHEALPPWKRLRATVQLSVLYPPGVPDIKGYREGEILMRGQTVELICQSRGGNPPAQLVWYKNGEQVRAVYRSIGRVSENVYSFVADMNDNKARFTCEASSVINHTRLTSEVSLVVYYPPVVVTINGSSEARVGDIILLSCTAGPSNPAATITWLIDGKKVENALSRVEASADNGWITYSNTTVVVEPNKTSVVAFCYGINTEVNENKMATHTITVLYPPGKPEIRIQGHDTFIPAGSLQSLICSSSGGNPLATLRWFRNDKEIPSEFKVLDKIVVAEIKILVNGSDNEAIYKCEAENSAIDIPYFKVIKLPVYFPPLQAKITKKPEELRAGITATLICDVGASNPEPELSWWMDGLEVNENITKFCKMGLYGGRVCTSELSLNLTSDMDNRRYTCRATNVPLQRSANDVIVLNVMYKPVIAELNESSFTEVEGYGLIVPLRVSANPNKIKYTWSKDGVPLAQNFESTLNITSLHRADSGVYSCEAINSLGSSTVEFRIIVLYAATILHITDVVMVAEHETAILECTVDGKPLTGEHVTWKRVGFPMETKTNFSFRNITSSLTVYNVTQEDMGSFYCVVDNGIGNESSQPALLVVKHKPIVDLSEPLTKAASQIGNMARLICKASGAPSVTFSWSKGGVVLPQNTTDKYVMLYKQSNIIHHTSTLLIHNVAPSDYDTYGCTARNVIGFSTHSVKLQSVSAPDPPFQLKTVNVTHDSITLSWEPGFDGGEAAHYRIRYSAIDADKNSYRKEDVGTVTVYTVQRLHLATCYNFNVMAQNKYGSSNYMRSEHRACSLSEGPPSLPSRGEVSNENVNKLPFAVGLVVAITLIVLNASVVIFCIVKRSKNKFKDNSSQPNNSKSENTDLYSPENFNNQMHAESVTSVSEKSENYDKSYSINEGRCSALNTYLIEEIDYPFQDTSAYEIEVKPEKLSTYQRTSTICRNGSLCQRMDHVNPNLSNDPQFIAYPPPIQFAQPSLHYLSNQRGHIPGPPPDVTVQTVQSVPLSTFNYSSEHDGQLV